MPRFTAFRRIVAFLTPIACLSLLAGSLTGCAGTARRGYEKLPTPANDPMHAQIYRLENGMMVYLTKNTQEPRFYSEIAVRAGSKYDPAETTGLAHYLEHLLFKGSQNLGTLDYAKEKPHLDRIEELYEQHFAETDPAKRAAIYQQIGAESQLAAKFAVPNELDTTYSAMGSSQMNAHTWLEEVVYKIELPSNRLPQWTEIESDRFESPVFRVFQPELEIVYEEKNRWMDNKEAILTEAVMKARYAQHPYGTQTTIGTAEHLKKPSLKKIREYYDTWYVPNNMGIFISGDIEPKEAIKTISREFNRLKPKPLPAAKTWPTETVSGRSVVELKYPGEEKVMLGFPTVSHNHPDAEPLMLADMVLSNTAAGLIDLNLNQAQRVRAAGCYPQFNNDAGTQFFYAVPKSGQTPEEAEKLLLEQIELLKKGEFPDWLLPAIITDFKKGKKSQLEDNTARVQAMRETFIAHEDWDDAVGEIDRLEKLTREDVIRVANKYFGSNYVVGIRRDGKHSFDKIEKPKLDKLVFDQGNQSEFAKKIIAEPVAPIEPVYIKEGKEYTIVREANGRSFYYTYNPLNDLFSLTISTEVGTDSDPRLPLVSQFIEKAGTKTLTADELKQQWYRLGSDFSAGLSEGETGFTISGLDENFEETYKLATDLLNDPKVAPEAFETLKAEYLGRRADRRKEPAAITDALVAYNRFGSESAYLRELSSDKIQALTEQELLDALRAVRGTKHLVAYTGSLPLAKVRALVNSIDPVKGELKDAPPFKLRTIRETKQNEILFVNKETAQSQVRLDIAGNTFEDSRVPASQLFNDAFGFVVYQQLREARALAYSAQGAYINGDRAGRQNFTTGMIGTQVDKTIEATEGFMALLHDMPIAEENFATSHQTVENLYRTSRLGFREVIPAVRRWERLKLDGDPRPRRFAAIQAATLQTVQDFSKTQVQNRPLLISIVGDKNRIDQAALNKLAPVREVSVDEIFPK